MSIDIRPAGPDDAALVLRFIRELAEYERLLHEARATEADVVAVLFCDRPRAFCDIVERTSALMMALSLLVIVSNRQSPAMIRMMERISMKYEPVGVGPV